MTSTQRGGTIGKLIFWSFIAIVLAMIAYVVVTRGGNSPVATAPGPVSPTYAADADGLLRARSPNYPGEGAVGILEGQENAGAAVNPITPTGQAGGPAGQTPAYGQPGGVGSRVNSP